MNVTDKKLGVEETPAAQDAPETQRQKLLRQLEADRINRTPLISEATLAYVDEIAKDKEKAIAFLKKGGFFDEEGNLAAKYRPAK